MFSSWSVSALFALSMLWMSFGLNMVSSGISLFTGFPNADLELFVQALAENQYLRVLAEPTSFVPGTTMAFTGYRRPEDRRDAHVGGNLVRLRAHDVQPGKRRCAGDAVAEAPHEVQRTAGGTRLGARPADARQPLEAGTREVVVQPALLEVLAQDVAEQRQAGAEPLGNLIVAFNALPGHSVSFV